MVLVSALLPLVGLASAKDPVPAANDVTAGWLGFWVFVIMIVAVALLGWSLSRHLRRARDNAEAGMFAPTEEPKRRR